jgi:hypothetical protein
MPTGPRGLRWMVCRVVTEQLTPALKHVQSAALENAGCLVSPSGDADAVADADTDADAGRDL